ncbi:MAG: hypothetical protein A2Y38_13940 [Spirochaetes bacterium GWB1_59_5]|nr:MAG: hypothetical protein A2Y38_13940 [Spirochaetes bacterium GWB1_59_5]
MSCPDSNKLEVPIAPSTNGAFTDLFRFKNKWCQVSGTFTGTWQLQGSMSGAAYSDIGAAFTAPVLFEVPQTMQFFRVRCVAFASGLPVVEVAGFDERAV